MIYNLQSPSPIGFRVCRHPCLGMAVPGRHKQSVSCQFSSIGKKKHCAGCGRSKCVYSIFVGPSLEKANEEITSPKDGRQPRS
uniref:Nuclear receptor domain-containing protein n=1 Tax=Panagrellus redivivus TaxID=6233 RepID=A0A7E4USJ9_PANRE